MVPTGPLPEPVHDFLSQPNLAVMTTLRPDGQPVSVVVWYLLDDDGKQLLVNMDKSRKRIDYVRQDPRVALIAMSADGLTYLSVQGRVTELVDDPELRDVDRVFRHYQGTDFGNRESSRVTARIDVDRWHGWGKLKNAG